MKERPSWGDNSYSVSKEIIFILWTPSFIIAFQQPATGPYPVTDDFNP